MSSRGKLAGLGLAIYMVLLAGWPQIATPGGTPPRSPRSLPVLLPLMEHGNQGPEELQRLINGPLEVALNKLDNSSSPANGHCIDLSFLDRPSTPDSLDVLHYDIRMNSIDEGSRTFEAVTIVRLRALKDLTQFNLDLVGCIVDSVRTVSLPDSTPLNSSFVQKNLPDSSTTLTIRIPGSIRNGDSVDVRVAYRNLTPGCINDSGLFSGVVWTPVGVHTFSEPTYARSWYPSHDVPWDRATATIRIAAPGGRVVAASGVPAGSEMIEGKSYERWDTPVPMATYLNAFYLGDYLVLNDTGPDSIELQYFTYPHLEANTRVDFENIPDMIAFYSTFYSYPFPRYAMSLGFFGGGMEHTMNSLIGYFFIRGDRSYETLFAHELAHQWWGDLITLDTWRELWLNEGFAVYFEYLYTEYKYGNEPVRSRIAFVDSVYQARADSLDHPILDPPVKNPFTFVVYYKGARVLDMLRGVSRHRLIEGPPSPPEAHLAMTQAGDDRFRAIFTDYASQYAYSNVTTSDFQQVAETRLGEDLDWFFDPWLRGGGFPTWWLDWSATPQGSQTTIEVRVRQASTDTTQYSMPVLVRYRSGSQTLDEVRTIGSELASWSVSLPSGEWSVELDPEDWVLDRTEERPLVPGIPSLHVSPNPSAVGFTFSAILGGTGQAPSSLSVYDLAGRLVRRIDLGSRVPGQVSLAWDGRADDGTVSAPGMYFARLSFGASNATARLVLLP